MKGLVDFVMKEQNCTVEELAKTMGVSPRTVEGWRYGRPLSTAAQALFLLVGEGKVPIVREEKNVIDGEDVSVVIK